MEAVQERRGHPRRRLERSVFCYIDGDRMDETSEDVSAGGMFLRTADASTPMGALVAIVFRGTADPTMSVFLFGRVVRRQETPVPGLGLQWERAVCAGNRESLESFLKNVLGVDSPDVAEEPMPGKGSVRYVHRFPKPGPGKAAAIYVPRGPSAESPMPAPTELPHSAERGILTEEIQSRQTLLATSLDATLDLEGLTLPSRVLRLGVAAMTVETRVMPVDPQASVTVRFAVTTRDGEAPVVCSCKLLTPTPALPGRLPTLDLHVIHVDEGSRQGLLQRYLKWLAFRGMGRE
jgi:hypothetical protein